MGKLYYETELSHHGIKGQKWGVRRYQNPDGTLTAAGKKRAERQQYRLDKKRQAFLELDAENQTRLAYAYSTGVKRADKELSKRIRKDMKKHGNLSEKTKLLKKATEQLREDSEEIAASAYFYTIAAKSHLKEMQKTYANKRIKDMKVYSENGREYIKSRLNIMLTKNPIIVQKTTYKDNQGKKQYKYVPYEYRARPMYLPSF